MTDAESRALVRRAESTRAGDDWLRAAWALARARDWDEAGEAAARAQAAGTDAGEVLDSMAPPLEALVARTVGEPHPRSLAHPVFSWSGKALLGLDRTSVVSVDLATGERRVLGDVPCAIDRWGRAEAGPISPGPDGQTVAVAFRRARGKWCVALVSAGVDSSKHPNVLQGLDAVRSIANTGTHVAVATAEGSDGGATLVSLEETAVPTRRLSLHKRKGLALAPDFDRSGASVSARHDGFDLWRPFATEPHARIEPFHPERDGRPLVRTAGFRVVVLLRRWMRGGSLTSCSNEVRLLVDHATRASAVVPSGFIDAEAEDDSLEVCPGPSGSVVAINWAGSTPENARASPAYVRRLELLDVRNGVARTVALEETESDRLFALAWSPSGRKLAVTSEGESVLVWDADAGTPP